MNADNNPIFDDIAELAKVIDSKPCKAEQYWNPDTQKVEKLTRDFNPRNMLADLLGRKK